MRRGLAGHGGGTRAERASRSGSASPAGRGLPAPGPWWPEPPPTLPSLPCPRSSELWGPFSLTGRAGIQSVI